MSGKAEGPMDGVARKEHLRRGNALPRGTRRPDLSLVLPCYNEEAVLRSTSLHLAKDFQQADVDVELVLVDNGSQDGTGQVIDELVAEGLPVVKETVEFNRGYGYGVLRGLARAQGRFVGFMCADGQVDSKDAVTCYDIAARARTPTLAKVRRHFRMDGTVRKVSSIAYNALATALFGGLRCIDINGNPKIWPREWLEPMRLESEDWFLDSEVMIKAKRLRLSVIELNVMARMREGGRSNVRARTSLELLTKLLRYRTGLAGGSLGPVPDGLSEGGEWLTGSAVREEG